ncbi:beta-glucuronidase [Spirochaetia bacterium]|nr:beta-glucuronidase [Spirochaetia bacterium]
MEDREHPRPDFKRRYWECLDGIWGFAFDDAGIGESREWFRREGPESEEFPLRITVPFCYQSAASGIADLGYHPSIWYSRTFNVPEFFEDRRIILKFGAVDFECRVWVNGCSVGSHQGGYTPFSFDISGIADRKAPNRLTLQVFDRNDTTQPRGKQYWKAENDRCWYTPCSGIWQSVWLEAVPDLYITGLALRPDIDSSSVVGLLSLNARPQESAELRLSLSYRGRTVQTAVFSIREQQTPFVLSIQEEDAIDEVHYWSPETPNLYDLSCALISAAGETDELETCFGMRKISIQDGRILLNNRPLYQRLVLDQAYWEEGLLSPRSAEDFRKDVELIKALGFNGVRLHQKIEDPRFYYWADKLGLLVWGEMPSAYRYCPESCRHILNEWTTFIERDMNHPSIICWVPFNESWGLRNIVHNKSQQEFAAAIYHLTKALDGTRLVSVNDGWEQTVSDICGIHDYVRDGTALGKKLRNLPALLQCAAQNRMLYAEGFAHRGEPVLITEFGGIAFSHETDGQKWGYSGGVADTGEFLERLRGLVDAILECENLQGYCYTQLTDLMQEVNGLAYMNRKLKIPAEKFREIFSRSP